MEDLIYTIALDHKNVKRHLISVNSHNLIIEVINPRHETTLNMATEIRTDEVVFAALVVEPGQKRYKIYFRVIHPNNMKRDKPWSLEMFLDAATYYLKTKWNFDHEGFNIVNQVNMYPYLDDEEIIF